MAGLSTFLTRGSEAVAIRREGRAIATVRGLRSNTGRPHFSFLPGTDVQKGDVLCPTTLDHELFVTEIEVKSDRRRPYARVAYYQRASRS